MVSDQYDFLPSMVQKVNYPFRESLEFVRHVAGNPGTVCVTLPIYVSQFGPRSAFGIAHLTCAQHLEAGMG